MNSINACSSLVQENSPLISYFDKKSTNRKRYNNYTHISSQIQQFYKWRTVISEKCTFYVAIPGLLILTVIQFLTLHASNTYITKVYLHDFNGPSNWKLMIYPALLYITPVFCGCFSDIIVGRYNSIVFAAWISFIEATFELQWKHMNVDVSDVAPFFIAAMVCNLINTGFVRANLWTLIGQQSIVSDEKKERKTTQLGYIIYYTMSALGQFLGGFRLPNGIVFFRAAVWILTVVKIIIIFALFPFLKLQNVDRYKVKRFYFPWTSASSVQRIRNNSIPSLNETIGHSIIEKNSTNYIKMFAGISIYIPGYKYRIRYFVWFVSHILFWIVNSQLWVWNYPSSEAMQTIPRMGLNIWPPDYSITVIVGVIICFFIVIKKKPVGYMKFMGAGCILTIISAFTSPLKYTYKPLIYVALITMTFGDVLWNATALEFVYKASPACCRSINLAFSYFAVGIGIIFGGLASMTFIDKEYGTPVLNATNECANLLPSSNIYNLSNCYLTSFYFVFLGAIGIVAFLIFIGYVWLEMSDPQKNPQRDEIMQDYHQL